MIGSKQSRHDIELPIEHREGLLSTLDSLFTYTTEHGTYRAVPCVAFFESAEGRQLRHGKLQLNYSAVTKSLVHSFKVCEMFNIFYDDSPLVQAERESGNQWGGRLFRGGESMDLLNRAVSELRDKYELGK